MTDIREPEIILRALVECLELTWYASGAHTAFKAQDGSIERTPEVMQQVLAGECDIAELKNALNILDACESLSKLEKCGLIEVQYTPKSVVRLKEQPAKAIAELGVDAYWARDFGPLTADNLNYRIISRAGRYVYYMAPLANMLSILSQGILPYSRIRENITIASADADWRQIRDVSNPQVQAKRDHKQVCIGNQHYSLHDFVPLYMSYHTPMQYEITKRDFQKQCVNVLILLLDAAKVLELPGILMSDGNAASDATTFGKPIDMINRIAWSVIGTTNCFSADYKRQKAAEVLIPGTVPTYCFSELVVFNDKVADLVKQQIDKQGLHPLPVSAAEFMFYKQHNGKIKPYY